MRSFSLNGRTIQVQRILDDMSWQENLTHFEVEVCHVIRDWLDGKQEFRIKTSGSTGKSRDIFISRDQIKKSARRTLDEFGLHKNDTVLACLPPGNIAGFMMLVRAIEGNLNLIVVTPSANPLLNVQKTLEIDFVAFTPHQLNTVLKFSPGKLGNIDKILIGGAGLSAALERDVQALKSKVYHSYAMTETITHVAMRCVNGMNKSSAFHAMKGVSFQQDDRSCLVINDELLEIHNLVTNDIVDLKAENKFIWKGRFDHVINSGGIKIQIEELEDRIRKIFSESGIQHAVCLIPAPDKILGEILILLVEKETKSYDAKDLIDLLKSSLSKYHIPKKVIYVAKLFMTKSGKLDRLRNGEVYTRELKS